MGNLRPERPLEHICVLILVLEVIGKAAGKTTAMIKRSFHRLRAPRNIDKLLGYYELAKG